MDRLAMPSCGTPSPFPFITHTFAHLEPYRRLDASPLASIRHSRRAPLFLTVSLVNPATRSSLVLNLPSEVSSTAF